MPDMIDIVTDLYSPEVSYEKKSEPKKKKKKVYKFNYWGEDPFSFKKNLILNSLFNFK